MTESEGNKLDPAPLQGGEGAPSPVGGSLAARSRTLAARLLTGGEIIILETKPSLWFVPLVSAPWIALGLIIILAADLEFCATHFRNSRAVLSNLGIWIIVLRLGWALLQWSARLYLLTDRRLITQEGVLQVRVFECQLDRLQNTYVERTVLQRLLGLGTILFATAGTARIESVWQHINRPAEVHRAIMDAVTKFRKRMNGV